MADLWHRKMRTYFKRIDFDGDGVVTEKDFTDMADRFIKEGSLNEANANDLRTKVAELWQIYKSQAKDSNSINSEAFINAMTTIDEGQLTKATQAPFEIFFKIIDTNHDDQIQKEEFRELYRILRLKEADADASFANIDTNNDGLLSMQEFTTAGNDFFTSKNETPNMHFFGPLED